MIQTGSKEAKELALAASRLQFQRTGHAPSSVTVVFSEDTLVFTLHEALTPIERTLSQSQEGAARVQEFHRQLFATSVTELSGEIERITGRQVRESAAEIETASGSVIHAFTKGAMVQVFLLETRSEESANEKSEFVATVHRAEDDGLRVEPATDRRPALSIHVPKDGSDEPND